MGNQQQRCEIHISHNVQRLSKTRRNVEVSRVGIKRSRNGGTPEKECDIVRHCAKVQKV